jgi:hypothetical protein
MCTHRHVLCATAGVEPQQGILEGRYIGLGPERHPAERLLHVDHQQRATARAHDTIISGHFRTSSCWV